VDDATQTAVIVPVSAAEPVVAEHRARFDTAASWGVPAHLTVLYPFVDPSALDADVVRRLAECVLQVPAFDCAFGRCRWFDEDVLWLAPEPDQPFRELTVAQRLDGDPSDALAGIEDLVSAQLPVTTYVDRVLLMAGSPRAGGWRVLQELPLGGLGG
jgi:hypothetical protein